MSKLSDTELCNVLNQINGQVGKRGKGDQLLNQALQAAAGLKELSGLSKMAKGIVGSKVNLNLPSIDGTAFNQLMEACPDMLNDLPKDAKTVLAVAGALNSLMAMTPQAFIGQLLADPLSRLKSLEAMVDDVVSKVKAATDAASAITALTVPSPAGAVAKAVIGQIISQVEKYALDKVIEAAAKAVGVNAAALSQCVDRLCAKQT